MPIIRPKLWPTALTLTPGDFYSKSNGFFTGSEGRLPPKINLMGSICFEIFGHTDTYSENKWGEGYQ